MPAVTNTERHLDGVTPWGYGPVTIGLVGDGFDDAGGRDGGYAKNLTDAAGLVSFTLPGNRTGEYYVWTSPDQTQIRFIVPAAGGPYTLQSLKIGGIVLPGVPAASADALAALAAIVSGLGSATLTDNGDGTWHDNTTIAGYTKTGADAQLATKAEQLDYACDLSAVTTTIPTDGSSLDVAGGLGISCPATGTNRSLILRCGGAFQITAAGNGTLALQIWETTAGGAATLIGVSQVVGGFLLGTGSAFPSAATVSYDLGPTSTERQFKLMCAMIRDSASSLAAKVRSSTTGVVKAWIEGVAM